MSAKSLFFFFRERESLFSGMLCLMMAADLIHNL